MKIRALFSLFFILIATPKAIYAQASFQLFNGQDLTQTTVQSALSNIQPGSVIVLGEQHGTTVQPQFQLQVLETIRKMGLRVSLGMEFFEYSNQDLVNKYRDNQLSETDFLRLIQWGQGFPFLSYRSQVLFPFSNDFVIALNAPRALTGKISKLGLNSLTSQEWQQMPPDFKLGNAEYLERFKEVMGQHLPNPEALTRYFAAQSTWDETMAWKATDFLNQHPDQVLVIIVGEFHVQYGGGLPDRLRARGVRNLLTFSLLNTHDMSSDEIHEQLSPSTKYGVRANYLWTADY